MSESLVYVTLYRLSSTTNIVDDLNPKYHPLPQKAIAGLPGYSEEPIRTQHPLAALLGDESLASTSKATSNNSPALANVFWTWSSRNHVPHAGLLTWQFVNHFPSSRQLTRKDLLAQNLARATRVAKGARAVGLLRGVMPTTFTLPGQYLEFVEAFR